MLVSAKSWFWESATAIAENAVFRDCPRNYAVSMRKTTLGSCKFVATFFLLVAPALCQTDPSSEAKARPRIKEAAVPLYPPIAEAAHVTGKVTVSVTVQGGRVVKTVAQSESPAAVHFLQPAAILNIQTWRFGKDVNDRFTVTYTYGFAGKPSDEPTNPLVEILPSLDVKVTARPVKLYCSDGCPPEQN
jgi:hypothetical protein